MSNRNCLFLTAGLSLLSLWLLSLYAIGSFSPPPVEPTEPSPLDVAFDLEEEREDKGDVFDELDDGERDNEDEEDDTEDLWQPEDCTVCNAFRVQQYRELMAIWHKMRKKYNFRSQIDAQVKKMFKPFR